MEVFETRTHVGGNCHDACSSDGLLYHVYGAHIFHTNDAKVWAFLNRFTRFKKYEHRVVADTAAGRISIPYSAKTERQLNRKLSDEEIRELIFRQYSEKQWGMRWEEIPKSIVNRIPVRRESEDDRYFTDSYQGIPENGYTALCEAMLDGVRVHLGCGENDWRRYEADLIVYTGKIDALWQYRFGKLPYRSLALVHERKSCGLEAAVINQCNTKPMTRFYDNGWLTRGERAGGDSIITTEYPCAHHAGNTPFYPIPTAEALALYMQYKALAVETRGLVTMGRLACYAYIDMWMAVAQVMKKLDFGTGD